MLRSWDHLINTTNHISNQQESLFPAYWSQSQNKMVVTPREASRLLLYTSRGITGKIRSPPTNLIDWTNSKYSNTFLIIWAYLGKSRQTSKWDYHGFSPVPIKDELWERLWCRCMKMPRSNPWLLYSNVYSKCNGSWSSLFLFLSFRLTFFFNYVYFWVSVNTCPWVQCLWSEQDTGFSGAELSWAPIDVGAGIRTQVLCKSQACS